MKNNLKIIKYFNLSEGIQKIFESIKLRKISDFRLIFTVYAIIFSVFLLLSIPGLFNYEKYHNQIKYTLTKDFKINIDNVKDIKYRFVPQPHLYVKNAELKFLQEDSDKLAELKDIKIFISLFDLYRDKKIIIKNIKLKEGNYYLTKKNINYFINHLNNHITKPIEIEKSMFFYLNDNKEIVNISPVKKIKYFIDFKTKEKKLRIAGKLFDKQYVFLWKKDFQNPKKISSEIKFKNPNLKIKSIYDKTSINSPKKRSLKLFFLGKEIETEYFYRKNFIEIKNFNPNNENFLSQGEINLSPFYFKIDTTFNKQGIILLEKLLYYLHLYKNNIHPNFNGKLNIKIPSIQNSFLNSGLFQINFENSKLTFEKIFFKLKNFGTVNFDKIDFNEEQDKVILKSKLTIRIIDENAFYKKFLIPKEKRINIDKITLLLEKSLYENKFYISEIYINNKISKLSIDNEKNNQSIKLSNIQQFRKIIKDLFKEV